MTSFYHKNRRLYNVGNGRWCGSIRQEEAIGLTSRHACDTIIRLKALDDRGRHGGIGRHKGLKILRKRFRTGSTPVGGTRKSRPLLWSAFSSLFVSEIICRRGKSGAGTSFCFEKRLKNHKNACILRQFRLYLCVVCSVTVPYYIPSIEEAPAGCSRTSLQEGKHPCLITVR